MLGMLEFVNMLASLAGALGNTTMYPDEAYLYATRLVDQVVKVSLHTEIWRHDGLCKYTGVMVPYSRDWEIKVTKDYVLPAEPTKIIGNVVVINQRSCPGKPADPLFNMISMPGTSGAIETNAELKPIYFVSFDNNKLPIWAPQVLKTILTAAKTDPVAREFVDFSQNIFTLFEDSASAVQTSSDSHR